MTLYFSSSIVFEEYVAPIVGSKSTSNESLTYLLITLVFPTPEFPEKAEGGRQRKLVVCARGELSEEDEGRVQED